MTQTAEGRVTFVQRGSLTSRGLAKESECGMPCGSQARIAPLASTFALKDQGSCRSLCNTNSRVLVFIRESLITIFGLGIEAQKCWNNRCLASSPSYYLSRDYRRLLQFDRAVRIGTPRGAMQLRLCAQFRSILLGLVILLQRFRNIDVFLLGLAFPTNASSAPP